MAMPLPRRRLGLLLPWVLQIGLKHRDLVSPSQAAWVEIRVAVFGVDNGHGQVLVSVARDRLVLRPYHIPRLLNIANILHLSNRVNGQSVH